MDLQSGWKWSLVALAAVACGPAIEVEDGTGSTDSDSVTTGLSEPPGMESSDVTGVTDPTDPDPTDPDPTDPDPSGPEPVPTSNAVDVIVVVDNSGSMATAQRQIATSMGSLVAALDSAGADWRIGITTTDNGNPWCDGTSPEAGNFRATTCRARTQDFLFNGAIPVDATQEACLDVCPEEWSDIPLPTPWIEGSGGATNLPAGLDPATALACLAPQGINGCGFEQPLESLYKAIRRTTTEGESSFGFMRPEAVLAILIITDEVDCSMNPAWETIFLPDGNRVFWSDPELASPTSAVCWNAGVSCTGGPGTYSECHAVNLDVDGNELPEPEAANDAVLHPLSRYLGYLDELEAEKKQINPAAEVVLGVIGGFTPEGSVVYEDGADPDDQLGFGIGVGCQSETTRGFPPVRMRELGEALSTGVPTFFSVCDGDYTPHFETFGKAIADFLP